MLHLENYQLFFLCSEVCPVNQMNLLSTSQTSTILFTGQVEIIRGFKKKGFTSVVNIPIPACFVPSTFLTFIWFLTYCLILSTIFPWFLTHSSWDLSDLTHALPPPLSVPTCLSFPHPKFSCHLCARPQYDALWEGVVSSAHAEWTGGNRRQGGRKDAWKRDYEPRDTSDKPYLLRACWCDDSEKVTCLLCH